MKVQDVDMSKESVQIQEFTENVRSLLNSGGLEFEVTFAANPGIAPNETKLVGSGKYITQILAGVPGTGSKTWTFKWIAPIKGSGNLDFYGAFLIGGKPQTVVTSSLEIKEKLN